MNESINLVLAGLVLVSIGGTICLFCSPDCLDRVALKFRARARGMRAAKESYWKEWAASYMEDHKTARKREEARMMYREFCSDEQGRITE